jgi:hypothetical protein
MIAQVSAEAFDRYDNPGKGKGNPVVPESGAYGAAFMLLCVLAIMAKRWYARRSIK